MKQSTLNILMIFILSNSCAQTTSNQPDKIVGGRCEDCDLMFDAMPDIPDWQIRICDISEEGEPLIISGRILQSDGKTPAPNVILYVYHTDNSGRYSRGSGKSRRHGKLRGWMKTDATGRYEFRTIKPAAYPGRTDPAHIHPIIKEPGKREYYIDDYLFDDDPLLAKKGRDNRPGRGGDGIIHLLKNNEGAWTGTRDIILGKNIPDYQ